jgi:hypothetical protein
MSAWGIGRRGGTEALSAESGGAKAFIDRLVQWIPADVIAIYTVGITQLRTEHPDPNPSLAWMLIAALIGFLLVLFTAWRSRKRIQMHDLLLAVVAVVAFGFWALAIPDSGWYEWSAVANHPGWVALIAGAGGLLLGAAASTFLED